MSTSSWLIESKKERKLLVHDEMYRLFVSCKPRVLCNDIVGVIESFIPWWSKCAIHAKRCVRMASDTTGRREEEYSTSEEEEEEKEEKELPKLSEKRSRK